MKLPTNTTGLFGKLPAHGDFVQRNLPAGFINVWDEWLQHFVSGTKEQLGENWLDIYLTSPLWRFVFSTGVVDENIWAGIMIPSVDRVGRYYPFSIIKKISHNANPFEFIQQQSNWYKDLETLALDALDGQLMIDDLMAELEKNNIQHVSDYSRSSFNLEGDAFQFDVEFEEQAVSSTYPLLLDTLMTKAFQSYSIWQTTGSNCISPCLFSSQGLPKVQQMPAMLNGEWQNYQWQQPYFINEFEQQEHSEKKYE